MRDCGLKKLAFYRLAPGFNWNIIYKGETHGISIHPTIILGGVLNYGYPQVRWMVYVGENPIEKNG